MQHPQFHPLRVLVVWTWRLIIHHWPEDCPLPCLVRCHPPYYCPPLASPRSKWPVYVRCCNNRATLNDLVGFCGHYQPVSHFIRTSRFSRQKHWSHSIGKWQSVPVSRSCLCCLSRVVVVVVYHHAPTLLLWAIILLLLYVFCILVHAYGLSVCSVARTIVIATLGTIRLIYALPSTPSLDVFISIMYICRVKGKVKSTLEYYYYYCYYYCCYCWYLVQVTVCCPMNFARVNSNSREFVFDRFIYISCVCRHTNEQNDALSPMH